jgi:TonB family protein
LKKILYIYLFFALGYNCFGQSKSDDVFTVVESMPEYPGGTGEMMKFIQATIKYPTELKDKSIGGKVYVKFIVDTEGKVRSVEILKSSGFYQFDEEALRVVSLMPTWKPGKQNEKLVKVYFNLPMSFNLSNPYYVCNVNNKDPDYKESVSKVLAQDSQNALEALNKCLKSNPNDGDALYNKAILFLIKKDNEKGCESMKLAVKAKHSIAEKVINNYCN